MLAVLVFGGSFAAAQDGATLYKQSCAMCHDGGMDRAPTRDDLEPMSADRVLAAMETGPMISIAAGVTAAERRTIAPPTASRNCWKAAAIDIDYSATQDYKKQRVATALGRIPDHVTYAPIDFATESLAAALRQSGHRPNEKTFYICEGVSMYVPVRQQIAQASQSGYWLAELIVPERHS